MYLINAFVFCKLFYCSTVWSNTSKENIRKLQLVQNYACRIVTDLKKYYHFSEAPKSVKWLNVKGKLLFNDLVMVYKCMNNLTPDYLRERFQHCVVEFSTTKENLCGAPVRQSKGLYLSDFLRLFTIHTISELSTLKRSQISSFTK